MRGRAATIAMILMTWMVAAAWIPATPVHAANDDLPNTFLECVLAGGDVRRVGEDVRCRLVKSWDFRVYYTATTECDEQVELEAWGETHGGVVTVLFAPHLTVEMPVDTRLLDGIGIGTPIPCLDD